VILPDPSFEVESLPSLLASSGQYRIAGPAGPGAMALGISFSRPRPLPVPTALDVATSGARLRLPWVLILRLLPPYKTPSSMAPLRLFLNENNPT
jgi:hypothetical protein